MPRESLGRSSTKLSGKNRNKKLYFSTSWWVATTCVTSLFLLKLLCLLKYFANKSRETRVKDFWLKNVCEEDTLIMWSRRNEACLNASLSFQEEFLEEINSPFRRLNKNKSRTECRLISPNINSRCYAMEKFHFLTALEWTAQQQTKHFVSFGSHSLFFCFQSNN